MITAIILATLTSAPVFVDSVDEGIAVVMTEDARTFYVPAFALTDPREGSYADIIRPTVRR